MLKSSRKEWLIATLFLCYDVYIAMEVLPKGGACMIKTIKVQGRNET